MPQIFIGTFDEVKDQLEKAYMVPNNIPEKVYTEKLNWETHIIYRALRVYKKYVKYPLEITVLDDRPKGRYCVYSDIDGEEIDGHGTGIKKQYVYICPYNLICPFGGGRLTVARIAEDIYCIGKSVACRKQKNFHLTSRRCYELFGHGKPGRCLHCRRRP